MVKRRKMAGELHREATADTTNYDALDVGYALADDVLKEVWKCIDAHKDVIDVDEFCVILLLCDDNILTTVKRIKYYAWPFLPEPRPRQTVFHYNRKTDDIVRLWSLPTAKGMAVASEKSYVDKKWQQTKAWCDAFFRGAARAYFGKEKFYFYEYIRKESGVKMLCEKEHIQRLKGLPNNKFSQLCHDEIDTLFPKAFDAFKPFESKVVNSD